MTAKLRARQQSEWEARQARRQRTIIAVWVAVGVAFLAMLAYLVWQEAQPEIRPGADVPILQPDHIPVGSPHAPYNSEPPTSGPHYDSPAQAGFYEEAPPDEQLVHNLEHGHVIIWYNCSDLSEEGCTELKEQIREVMSRSGNSNITGTLKLVAVPRPSLDTRLALTSWGRLHTMDEFDRQTIQDFIRYFRDRAPEPNAA